MGKIILQIFLNIIYIYIFLNIIQNIFIGKHVIIYFVHNYIVAPPMPYLNIMEYYSLFSSAYRYYFLSLFQYVFFFPKHCILSGFLFKLKLHCMYRLIKSPINVNQLREIMDDYMYW